jgi:hypothetical protein
VNEVPTQWLEKGNPWEIERAEIIYKVNMGGEIKLNNATKTFEWHHEDTV